MFLIKWSSSKGVYKSILFFIFSYESLDKSRLLLTISLYILLQGEILHKLGHLWLAVIFQLLVFLKNRYVTLALMIIIQIQHLLLTNGLIIGRSLDLDITVGLRRLHAYIFRNL